MDYWLGGSVSMNKTILKTYNLTKNFGALRASDKISIDLRMGEIHGLIGPNGAGKTTLIAQIMGGLKPDSGVIEFDGTDITSFTTESRAQAGLGRTFQISQLAMDQTVLQNVVLGTVGETRGVWKFWRPVLAVQELRERAMESLSDVGLADKAATPVSELSHGGRRQLEVAIALTLNPKAFVMDEPMAGLGSDGSKKMTIFLDNLRARAPILLVEHDMEAVFALSDRISVLVSGVVIATGSVDQIRNDARVRKAYLGEDS